MGNSQKNEAGKTLDNVILGTAMSALQSETALGNKKRHDWFGLKAKDGATLEQTIEHEKHMAEDAELIAEHSQLYRFSCDWAKLQLKPYAPFDKKEVKRYREFLGRLKDKGVKTMLVMHHFASPIWFSKKKGFEILESLSVFTDYARQLMDKFGDLVDYWNTFNEPTTLVYLGYLSGEAPPYKKWRLDKTIKVLKNIKKIHNEVYEDFKKKGSQPIGISNNTMTFYAFDFWGYLPSQLANYFYNQKIPREINKNVDFIGLAHYGKVGLNPRPMTPMLCRNPLILEGKEYDKMFEKDPTAFKDMLLLFSEMFDKPIFITETGYCTSAIQEVNGEDKPRVKYIKETLRAVKEALDEGADIRAYILWSTFDNFELALGPSYKYGIIAVDKDMNRKPKESAKFYRKLIMAENREEMLSEN